MKTVETRLPAIPKNAATCAIIGPRRAGNHRVPSRRTLMNVIASPQPSRAREARAVPYDVENAKPSWPTVKRTTPNVSIRFVPTRSTRRPTGICMPAYTRSWRIEKVERAEALTSKRSAASRPATPRLVRKMTATK